MKKIAVVGGGILGLTALNFLVEAFPRVEFHLFAGEIFNRRTCSFRKGGFVDPFLAKGPHVSEWTLATYQFFESLYGAAPGLMQRRLSVFSESPQPLPTWLELLPDEAGVGRIDRDPFGIGWCGGYQLQTFVLDQELFLPWLLGRCSHSLRQIHRQVISAEDSWEGFDAIVCAPGMGAQEFGFDDLVAVRGQWTLLEGDLRDGPVGNGVFVGPEGGDSILTYLVGGDGWTILGGTYQENDPCTEFREGEHRDYLERASRMFPGLRSRRVLTRGVQFRPSGIEPRVVRRLLGGGRPIYYLVAPGGAGVSLCAGYARQVVEGLQGDLVDL